MDGMDKASADVQLDEHGCLIERSTDATGEHITLSTTGTFRRDQHLTQSALRAARARFTALLRKRSR